jgi:NAD(P)-dependent dehydrogenase (short-subunit alcohol dehydrogenase family)
VSRLAGQRVLVTGAGGGIGGAIARRCAGEGARVVGCDLAGAELVCDIAEEQQVEDLVAAHGPFDAVVHAAALLGGSGRFPDVTTKAFDRYVRVNLRGAFLVARAAARAMIAHGIKGRLVMIGSVDSLVAELEAAPYVAAKTGLLGLVRAMAVDLGPHGITANLVAPGPILVERNRALFGSEPLRSGLARAVPLGGPGEPEAVAEAALYLVDPRTRFVTGAALAVDGGITTHLRQT